MSTQPSAKSTEEGDQPPSPVPVLLLYNVVEQLEHEPADHLVVLHLADESSDDVEFHLALGHSARPPHPARAVALEALARRDGDANMDATAGGTRTFCVLGAAPWGARRNSGSPRSNSLGPSDFRAHRRARLRFAGRVRFV